MVDYTSSQVNKLHPLTSHTSARATLFFFVNQNKLHPGRIACEIVAGTMAAFVGYMLCVLWLKSAPHSLIPVLVIVVYLTIALAASLVVYFIGNIGKRRGRYLFTLLGGILGIGIYMAIIFIMNALGFCPS